MKPRKPKKPSSPPAVDAKKSKKAGNAAAIPNQKKTIVDTAPVCRLGLPVDLIGKTLTDSAAGVSAAKKDAILAEYPSPPYRDITTQRCDGTYDVSIFV